LSSAGPPCSLSSSLGVVTGAGGETNGSLMTRNPLRILGDHAADLDVFAYEFTTASWFFIDAADVMAPADTIVVCAFGDSITDGTHTTFNINDRWSNVLSRRLHNAYGNKVSVVNEAIGGNRVVNPVEYDNDRRPFTPSAKRVGRAAGVARRIGARLLHEVREALPPTILSLLASTLLCLPRS
jgi:hypothetical protein